MQSSRTWSEHYGKRGVRGVKTVVKQEMTTSRSLLPCSKKLLAMACEREKCLKHPGLRLQRFPHGTQISAVLCWAAAAAPSAPGSVCHLAPGSLRIGPQRQEPPSTPACSWGRPSPAALLGAVSQDLSFRRSERWSPVHWPVARHSPTHASCTE